MAPISSPRTSHAIPRPRAVLNTERSFLRRIVEYLLDRVDYLRQHLLEPDPFV